jgi:hypothetical protein
MVGLEQNKKGERSERYIDSSFISMKEYMRRSLLLQQIRGPTDGIVIEGLDLLSKHEAEEDTISLDTDSSGSFANNSLTKNRKRFPRRSVRTRQRPKPNGASRRASTGSNKADKLKTAELEQESQFKMNGGALSKISARRFSNCAA